MLNSILSICRNNPQILVFLALASGYAIGKLKFRGFSLGPTTGVLVSALALGQIGIDVPEMLKDICFALFTFCIGYKVGPQFFGALKKDGVKYILISLVIAFVALGTAIGLGKIYGFDKGTTVGLFAGSVTQSAAIGTAEGAIAHLHISAAEKAALDTNVAVSYAITYVFGTVGLLIFLKLVPKILRIDYKGEAKKLYQQMSGSTGEDADHPELFSWSKLIELRAYQVTSKDIAGKSVIELEALFPQRATIEKIKRENQAIEVNPDTILNHKDIIAIIGRSDSFLEADKLIGPEVKSENIRSLTGEILDVCVLSPKIAGMKLGDIDTKKIRGVFLRRITRQGHELPITKETVINKCDILSLSGAKDDVERVVAYAGYPERPTSVTDLITVGIGCAIGTLFGLGVVHIGDISITLGMGGGVLVSGLIFGWLRTKQPTFGQIPNAAQWLLMNLGLNLFIACVGLTAGPQALHAMKTTGLSVFTAGAILALLPVIAGLIFGRFVLKMNPVLLMGALAGGRVLSAALNMLQEDAGNSTPLLGYAVPYAFGNVLLTIWGAVIVGVM